MAYQDKSFVLGNGAVPDWFNAQLGNGRAKIVREDGEILHCMVYNPARTYKAFPGDTIIMTKSGLVVIPAADAVRYNVRHNRVKEE